MTSSLSILIPVYDRDVRELLTSLVAMRHDWSGPLEILLLDDASGEEFRALNRELGSWPSVTYRELPHNVGRAAIRNQLAASAQHKWLLLLDNDSLLPNPNFLAQYAAALGRAPVLIGGTCYAAAPPIDAARRLRWLYGQVREARPAAVRQRAPYGQLAINNALVRTDIFRQFALDESLRGYGHEDTRFGEALAAARVPVLHLDNPVLHDGLEPAALFLEKSQQAVHNLARLEREGALGASSRLLAAARRLQQLGLAPAARAALGALVPALRRQLLGATPRLRALDALKLYWLLRELG